MILPAHLMLKLVTPNRSIVCEPVDEVRLPGSQGYLGVLPGHTKFLTTLQIGELWFRQGEVTSYVSVAFGFAEVLPDRVTVLAQVAERAEEIDIGRAEEAARHAQDRLSKAKVDVDFEQARNALTKALTRVQVASKARE